MNEAHFQALIIAEFDRIFPLLCGSRGVEVERWLTLRLGHHTIQVDGYERAGDRPVHGRLDALIRVEGRPRIVFELKAPGVALQDADVIQGRSYALHLPEVAPLVVVTNGADTRIIQAYDGAPLDPGIAGAQALEASIAAGARRAAHDVDETVRILLGSDERVWRQLSQKLSREARAARTSTVADVRAPLVADFRIPREATVRVRELIMNGTKLVFVHGPPLSGVTNILAELSEEVPSSLPVLLIDAAAAPNVLQHLANLLSRELFTTTTADDVRRWLISSLAQPGAPALLLAIDGEPREGISELREIIDRTSMSLVVGVGDAAHQRLTRRVGRTEASPLARGAASVPVEPLSDDEFAHATELLRGRHVTFFPGAMYARELRAPRMLRVVAATVPAAEDVEAGEVVRVFPMLGPGTLITAWNTWIGGEPELARDIRKVVEALLAERAARRGDVDWAAATYGRPSVDRDIAERAVGEGRIERLIREGFAAAVEHETLGGRVILRPEELFAHATAWQLARAGDSAKPEDFVREVIAQAELMPHGAVLAALALLLRMEHAEDPATSNAILMTLAKDEPNVATPTSGSRAVLLLEGGAIDMNFGQEPAPLVGNLFPWLVLSHLLGAVLDEGDGITANAKLFARLGKTPYLLRYVEPSTPDRLDGIPFHEVPGVGAFPCIDAGLVEPLAQSMLTHAQHRPDELVLLARAAVEKNEVHLAWRVHTVARLAAQIANESIRIHAEVARKHLHAFIGERLETVEWEQRASDEGDEE
ncbi:type I restriction enzyme HsdR N-terminal domain-containing protein [Polyangium fumosum]|uniref:type I restriction enzyme HsdR N-terminal domain-containing protein n=1 Tax=Polyangium fumosum TaxID=889272 RepID=UPI0014792F76|nr:type I restriction enzyme HsdR N-terminal domain-containing protein [Polyangium fumosum]